MRDKPERKKPFGRGPARKPFRDRGPDGRKFEDRKSGDRKFEDRKSAERGPRKDTPRPAPHTPRPARPIAGSAGARSRLAADRKSEGGSSREYPEPPKPKPALHMASPWVKLRNPRWGPIQFRNQVMAFGEDARPGAMVSCYDQDQVFLGRGIFNPDSKLAVRVLTRVDEPIDEAWFAARLARAVELRRGVFKLDAVTDAYRLVHAEGDGLSGLVADKLGDVLSVECSSLGMWRRMERIAPRLAELADCPRIHVSMDQRMRDAEGISAEKDPEGQPDGARITEHGVRFRLRFAPELGGHKTGFFCDQRENRFRFAQLVAGRSVLDVCCYGGGFGIYARKLGDASEVTAVDLDEKAIALAKDNANLNQVRMELVHSDAFTWMRQMQTNDRRWGCAVVDPSKFVSTPEDKQLGRQKYIDLNKLAISLLEPGGLLLSCSCSGLISKEEFLRIVCDAARYVDRRLQILDQTGAGPDHPVMAEYPEGEYLKAVWARVF